MLCMTPHQAQRGQPAPAPENRRLPSRRPRETRRLSPIHPTRTHRAGNPGRPGDRSPARAKPPASTACPRPGNPESGKATNGRRQKGHLLRTVRRNAHFRVLARCSR
jgi:hypothetical protein